MRLVSGDEMKKIDWLAIETGLPGSVLMENAGRQVAAFAKEVVGDRKGDILILCGTGNNGGDGFVAARYLVDQGYRVQVLILGKRPGGDDAGLHFSLIENLALDIAFVEDKETLFRYGETNYLLIIDALLGTGLQGEVKGLMAAGIEFINSYPAPVLSVDIPSGIDSNNGMVLGEAVRADHTVTFAWPKIGNVVCPGYLYNGNLQVVDIGIPRQISEKVESFGKTADFAFIQRLLPKRSLAAHKGSCGKILIVGGSLGMSGAPILTARAALKAGAGFVAASIPAAISDVFAGAVIESIHIPLPSDDSGFLAKGSLEILLDMIPRFDAVVLGPGLGRSRYIKELIKVLVIDGLVPLLIDADGLNGLNPEDLRRRQAKTVLTPHYGEMSRLMKVPLATIAAAPLVAARSFAKEYGTIVVLKGPRSIIASPQGCFYINTTGNPGMATAGSGDVLVGIMAGLVGQMDDFFQACLLATYLHGFAGDLAEEEQTVFSMTAENIIEALPQIFKRCGRDDSSES